jgi:TetR/AcrR family transcriptional regulator
MQNESAAVNPETVEAGASPKKTRIQHKREKLILDSALEVFAIYGFHGATIDQISSKADISKPNLLYYFRTKEHIYKALLERTMAGWLDAFHALNPNGDPMAELEKYVDAKMELSFAQPEASRLFAMEVQGGAPHLMLVMQTTLKAIVDDKAAILQRWMDQGKIKRVDPYHLIFSIWSVTQHYADFAIQIDALLGPKMEREAAKEAVKTILLRGLRV